MTGVSGAGAPVPQTLCRSKAQGRGRDHTEVADLRSRLGRQPGPTGEEGPEESKYV